MFFMKNKLFIYINVGNTITICQRKVFIIGNIFKNFFYSTEISFFSEPSYAKSNYWLNAILLEDRAHRDNFLKETNDVGVMTRPLWQLMINLPMYKECMHGDLTNSLWFQDRLVNLPSSVTPELVRQG